MMSEAPLFSSSCRHASPARLLLVAPYSSYRVAPFINAARARGIAVFLLSGRTVMELPSDVPGATFDPEDEAEALAIAESEHLGQAFTGICATDDGTTGAAARVAARLGLVFNDPGAVALTRNKLLARERLREAGLPCPPFALLDARRTNYGDAGLVPFPLVVKPLSLSASRGVIRVDEPAALPAALSRIARLLEREFAEPDYGVIAESYVPGFEIAVEGLLSGGSLQVLAVFDKPEPLHGPYFEETFYTTPSRLSPAVLEGAIDTVRRVCTAFGLREGPIHAEVRVNEDGAWLLELASRTIGGKCARLLSLATGLTLEEIVIAHALGERPETRPIEGGAGVLMVPVPASGVVRRVEGIGDARHVPGVDEVEIDVATGQVLTAWPEGGSYPGFVFSRGADAYEAERSLRRAHELIRIVTAPLLA